MSVGVPDFSIFDDKTDAIDIYAIDIYVDYFVAAYHRKIYEARLSDLIFKVHQLNQMKSEVDKFKTIIETHLSPMKNRHHESIIRKISILSLSLTCLQTNIQIDDDIYQRLKFKDVYTSTEKEYDSESYSDEEPIVNVHETITEHFNPQTYIKLQLNELMFFSRWTLYSSGRILDLSQVYKIINKNFYDKELEIYTDFLHQIEHDPFSTRELS